VLFLGIALGVAIQGEQERVGHDEHRFAYGIT